MKKVLSLLLTVMLLFALAVPAMPAEFTPSAEASDAPAVVEMTDSEGNVCDAVMVDADGNETPIGEGYTIELNVTPLAEAEKAPTQEIAENLESAYEELVATENLAEIVPELNELMAGVAANPEDLVVTKVFDMTLVDENGNPLVFPEGAIVTCKVKTDLTENDIFFVLHQKADGTWEAIEGAYIDEEGNLVIPVTGMSPFAIVKVGEISVEPVQPGTGTIPSSPQTGDSFPALYLVCALLCAGVAVVLFKKAGKKA